MQIGRLTGGILLLVLFQGAVALAGQPYLVGRWGDTRTPPQLISPYKTHPTNGLVVVTFSSVCPLAKRLVPILNEMQGKVQKDGIQFIALFPNGRDHVLSMAEFALKTDVSFPIYKDDEADPWAEQLGMKVTPEVVFLDTRQGYDASKVVYRGQVNDMWFGGGTANGKRQYLQDAISAFLQGKKPTLEETAASGCAIAAEAHRDLSAYAGVTFYKDILPIIQNKCQTCHRDGEAGAELFMAFDDYDTVASMYDTIIDRVKNRIMPPWHAQIEDKAALGGFQHDARLSEEQINTLIAWGEQDLKAGDPKDAPAPRDWPAPDEWKIGTPDFVFQMAEPYIVPAKRLDEYQYYRIKADFKEDRYIQAIETRPGNKAVVHHIGGIVGPASDEQLTGTQAMLKFYGITGDKIRKIGDYVPGDTFNARTYPPGFGLKLPAGSDIVFEMHYTPTGEKQAADVSKMGIIWAKKKPEHILETKVFNRKDIRLRPHDSHYKMTNWHAFSTDVKIYALAPHAHYRGKDYQLYKVTNPGTANEKRQLIMSVPIYDFNWQRTYEFEKPLELKAGDALYGVVHFDNSHFNPNNPDPEKFIRYGIKSDQEMYNLRVKFERVTLP